MVDTLPRRLRRVCLDVHLWLGVGLLVVLALLSLAGTVLVWHEPLEHALHPERYAVSGGPARPLADLAAAAEAAFAGRAQPTQLRAARQAGEPAVAVGRLPGGGEGRRPRTLNVWLDPANGRVLGTAEVARGPMMVLHRFHGTLLVPGVGRKLVGWLGWALFASCATGLWLWWPRFGPVLAGLRWRRGASQLFNLHHMVGFWTCLPLAVLALTGVYISFPQAANQLFHQPPPSPRPAQGSPLEAPRLSPGQAIALAQALRPEGRVTVLDWPSAGRAPAWRIELAEAGAAPVSVEVDEASGKASLGVARRSPAQRGGLAGWMRGVHDGSRGGAVWRWLISLAGLTPLLLGVTGLVMWLRRAKPAPAGG